MKINSSYSDKVNLSGGFSFFHLTTPSATTLKSKKNAK